MILYFIGGIMLIIILIFLFIRIKYRFWALQPVFHFYDFYYWFVNVGIIRHELPSTNRYTNFKEIKTYSFDRVPEDNLREFATLVQLNYFRDKDFNSVYSYRDSSMTQNIKMDKSINQKKISQH